VRESINVGLRTIYALHRRLGNEAFEARP